MGGTVYKGLPTDFLAGYISPLKASAVQHWNSTLYCTSKKCTASTEMDSRDISRLFDLSKTNLKKNIFYIKR